MKQLLFLSILTLLVGLGACTDHLGIENRSNFPRKEPRFVRQPMPLPYRDLSFEAQVEQGKTKKNLILKASIQNHTKQSIYFLIPSCEGHKANLSVSGNLVYIPVADCFTSHPLVDSIPALGTKTFSASVSNPDSVADISLSLKVQIINRSEALKQVGKLVNLDQDQITEERLWCHFVSMTPLNPGVSRRKGKK